MKGQGCLSLVGLHGPGRGSCWETSSLVLQRRPGCDALVLELLRPFLVSHIGSTGATLQPSGKVKGPRVPGWRGRVAHGPGHREAPNTVCAAPPWARARVSIGDSI